jgi:hypothetical protein
MIRRALYALTTVLLMSGCKETSGPAVAVTLKLYSVDGNVIPVPFKSPRGANATIGTGRLQGTNWGAACGFAAGLAEGPVTAVHIADCRLKPGEERKFTVVFSDTRFPAGSHEYRFIPE